jgi:hypothetical protein
MRKLFLFLVFTIGFSNFLVAQSAPFPYILGETKLPQLLSPGELVQFNQIIPPSGVITYESGNFTIPSSGPYHVAAVFSVAGGVGNISVTVNGEIVQTVSNGIVNLSLNLIQSDEIAFVAGSNIIGGVNYTEAVIYSIEE